jgi:hypothetical protein
MKTRKHFIGMAFVAILVLALAFIGCKQDEPPTPVPQSRDITIATGKTVTVNFTALPGTTPAWWDTLESVFHERAAAFDPGHYTLIVKTTGTDGFVVGETGSKTATVSEAFLSASDYTAMRASMGPIVGTWII